MTYIFGYGAVLILMNILNGLCFTCMQDISLESSTRHMSIEFQPSYVQPDTEQLTLIGVVTYNTKLAPRRHIDKGHILISTRNNGKLTIPYQAQIQQG